MAIYLDLFIKLITKEQLVLKRISRCVAIQAFSAADVTDGVYGPAARPARPRSVYTRGQFVPPSLNWRAVTRGRRPGSPEQLRNNADRRATISIMTFQFH
ncbi:hypothetical protein EVAR_34336_1 [Eumeta japonica]|uniref:Uncharacterized protein n=1 Tax=Eumeta variegata TaxID=151549 RepID=A0A4C1VD82_EUMVA|nr:hypothetical protein EVAR_34336_1 [Eumeta japonica]